MGRILLILSRLHARQLQESALFDKASNSTITFAAAEGKPA